MTEQGSGDSLMDEVMRIVSDVEANDPQSLPITRKNNYPWDGCQHQRVEVDDVLRRVTCRDCGVQLDPINVILNFHSYMRWLQTAVQRINEFERKEAARKERRKKRQP